MELLQRFKAKAGSALFLAEEQVQSYLQGKGWLRTGEQLIRLEKAGEGNMNLVLRAQTDRRRLIIKQARPWVEKYPQIEAPLERICVEAEFYRLIQQDEALASCMPRRLDWDPENYILILEDLGEGADFQYAYQKERNIAQAELEILVHFISHLHQRAFTAGEKAAFPSNQALKQLNHEHIFNFPYQEANAFDLDAVQVGLQPLSLPFKRNEQLKRKIRQLGERYLDAGPRLIHGDYYPGSWLKVATGVKIIDPEFSYFGLAEFDLGIMIGHLKMAGSSEEDIKWVLSAYDYPADFDDALRTAFTGVEIMRRIIGLAQLPLALSIDEKIELMDEALGMIEAWPAS